MAKLYDYNGIEYGFQQGGFDAYQVYNEQNGRRYCPFDRDYMNDLLILQRDNQDIYNDFVKVYERTNNSVNQDVFTMIEDLSNKYDDSDLFIKTMTNIYLTMVAEENKERAILKKRIKRIAIHKILVEGASVSTTVNEHKGVSWKVIDAECKERDF